MSNELKACEKCGCKADMYLWRPKERQGIIYCMNEFCGNNITYSAGEEQQAINAWNRRTESEE